MVAGAASGLVAHQSNVDIRKRIALQAQYDSLGADLYALAAALDAEPPLAPLPLLPDTPHVDFAPAMDAPWPTLNPGATCRPGCSAKELTAQEERTFALLSAIPRVSPGQLPGDVHDMAQAPPPWPRTHQDQQHQRQSDRATSILADHLSSNVHSAAELFAPAETLHSVRAPAAAPESAVFFLRTRAGELQTLASVQRLDDVEGHLVGE